MERNIDQLTVEEVESIGHSVIASCGNVEQVTRPLVATRYLRICWNVLSLELKTLILDNEYFSLIIAE